MGYFSPQKSGAGEALVNPLKLNAVYSNYLYILTTKGKDILYAVKHCITYKMY